MHIERPREVSFILLLCDIASRLKLMEEPSIQRDMGKLFRTNGCHSKTWIFSITCNKESSVLEITVERKKIILSEKALKLTKLQNLPLQKCNWPFIFYICPSKTMVLIAILLWTKTCQTTPRKASLLLPAALLVTSGLLISPHKRNASA